MIRGMRTAGLLNTLLWPISLTRCGTQWTKG